jgi:type IV secretion system protein TrbL
MIQIIRSVGLLVELYSAYSTRRAPPSVNPVLQRARRIRWVMWASVLVFALYELLTRPAGAQTSFQMFDQLVSNTETDSVNWYNSIQGLVKPTFTALGIIEICWAAAIWAFEKDSLNSLAVEVIKKMMFIGFFYTLLQYAGTWIPDLMSTFQYVAEKATDTTDITTDHIVTYGLNIATRLFLASIPIAAVLWAIPENAAGFSIPGVETGYMTADFEMAVCIIVCIGVLIAYVVVAAQFFALKVESSILFAAGAILLGLGSNSFTKDYTMKYISNAIHAGVRMLVLILLLSITLNAVKSVGTPPALDAPAMLTLLGASVLQAIVAMKAPDIASALMSGGGVGLSAGSAASALASTNQNLSMAAGLVNPAAKMAAGAAAGGGMAGGAGGNALRAGIGQVAGAVQGAGAKLGRAATSALADPGQQPSAAERLPGLGGLRGSGGSGQHASRASTSNLSTVATVGTEGTIQGLEGLRGSGQHGAQGTSRRSLDELSTVATVGTEDGASRVAAPHSGGFVQALENIAEETDSEIEALQGAGRATPNTAPAYQGAGASQISGTPTYTMSASVPPRRDSAASAVAPPPPAGTHGSDV